MTALVWCPFPDRGSAEAAADRLLDRGLVACANIIGGMQSLFVWNGERGAADEVGVLFKTDAALLEEVVQAVAEAHPYDCPAVLGWPCTAATAGTAGWLSALTGAGRRGGPVQRSGWAAGAGD
ncbi:divalent-cation tolerance protein CutA [Erythrobacteraceae bacterium CFH 75059]|uniref:divalent-cation tolerance protein CutA n=1 Tax=Qipengyuania thermophila TaxID=2509361 RepID=UPI0010214F18|nr:divalent-cation tolerance protein CutA [Qipengyuania thermophila]TCD06615.1 divalent-cation tolerance protein CutA [Erythrobacteraceae bacterium CFH 75059]